MHVPAKKRKARNLMQVVSVQTKIARTWPNQSQLKGFLAHTVSVKDLIVNSKVNMPLLTSKYNNIVLRSHGSYVRKLCFWHS